jgi:hypothetical protein
MLSNGSLFESLVKGIAERRDMTLTEAMSAVNFGMYSHLVDTLLLIENSINSPLKASQQIISKVGWPRRCE